MKDSAVKKFEGKELMISNPLDLPDPKLIQTISEPIILGTIMTPRKLFFFFFFYFNDKFK